MLRRRNNFSRTEIMKYILEVLWLLLLCIFSTNSSASDMSKTSLSQINCSNTGTYGNNNIALEWDNVNSSESTFYCSLTMNPYDDARFIRFAFRARSFFRDIFFFKRESFFPLGKSLSSEQKMNYVLRKLSAKRWRR